MNCQGCRSDDCFSCGYSYGLGMKRARLNAEDQTKRRAKKARRRRRRSNRAITFVLVLAISIGLYIAVRAAWDEPHSESLPIIEINEAPINSPAAFTNDEHDSDVITLHTPIGPENEATDDSIPLYTEEEREILAIIIYQEAGADYCSDDTRLKVGTVFLNRVASDEFPDTFYDVATAKAQYGTLYWTGIQWPERASDPREAHAVERSYEIADRLLEGERSFDEDVIWQAEFPQGTEVVAYQDGTYFCK